MVSGYVIALVVVIIWIVLLADLSRRIKKTKNFSLYGPALMIKTSKDRHILDKIARIFPAKLFSKISVVIFLVWSLLSISLLAYEAYLGSLIHVTSSPPLVEFLFIPGLNPVIPIFYGAFALIISVVLHELMHGIVARKHNVKVKAVGALFFVVPIGAFVEPDQEEIEKTDPVIRRRIFASGAGVNIVIAIVAFIVVAFAFMPAAHATYPGVYVSSIDSKSPASYFIKPETEIISIGNYTGNAACNVLTSSSYAPGTLVNVTTYNGTSTSTHELPAGVEIYALIKGYPAYNVSIPSGSVIYSINSVSITNVSVLSSTLDSIPPGTDINLSVLYYPSSDFSNPKLETFHFRTASVYDYYAEYYPGENRASYKHESFIGIEESYLGVLGENINTMKSTIFGNIGFSDFPRGFFDVIAIPFQGLSPVPAGLTSLFHVTGPSWLFWGAMNTIFWLFYANFLLALLNTLPMIIVDGGQFLKDTLKIASRHKHLHAMQSDVTIAKISNLIGVLVIFLILYELIAPRII